MRSWWRQPLQRFGGEEASHQEREPKDAQSYYYRGLAAFNKPASQRSYWSAMSDFSEAIRLDSQLVGAFMKRGAGRCVPRVL